MRSFQGDFGSYILRADHFAILNIRFRGAFASFHIVSPIISFGSGGCLPPCASYSQDEQQSSLHVSYFVSTCVDFASLEPLMSSGNILASLSSFTMLMIVSSMALAIASPTMSC